MALLKIKEAAEWLNICPSKVYSLIAEGKLGCYRDPNATGRGKCLIRLSEAHIVEYLRLIEVPAAVHPHAVSTLMSTAERPPGPPMPAIRCVADGLKNGAQKRTARQRLYEGPWVDQAALEKRRRKAIGRTR